MDIWLVTTHALQRFQQRVDSSVYDRDLILSIWNSAPDASDVDLNAFGGQTRHPSKLYRVGAYAGQRFLMIAGDCKIITIIPLNVVKRDGERWMRMQEIKGKSKWLRKARRRYSREIE